MNYKNQMNVLIDGIRKSYADWNGNPVDSKDEVRLNMIERFNSTIRIDNGRKFDKIVTGTSVWGFVAKDDGMFKNMPMKKGDVFKWGHKMLHWSSNASLKPMVFFEITGLEL